MDKDVWKEWEKEVELIQFYAMAQRYGFCTPYCECELCDKDLIEV